MSTSREIAARPVCRLARVRLVAGLCLAVTVFAPARARAESAGGDRVGRRLVTWSPEWPRFRAWEYAGTAVLGLSAWLYDRNRLPPEQPRWQGGILFDGAVRGWLRASSAQGRASAKKLSDELWLGGSAYPFVVDLPVALFVHHQPKVAWQMLMMDLEAYAVTSFLNRVLEFEVGRARPSVADCAANPNYDDLCGSSSNNASFPSGHTVGIATAAGLTCVHHRYLPLYGHPVADAASCALMSTVTAATGIARIVGDRHHATDVLFGAAIGFGVGYGMPWFLHYRYGARATAGTERAHALLLPWAAPGGVGAALVGDL
jgi:membrane-associated phospholipid phosphatase